MSDFNDIGELKRLLEVQNAKILELQNKVSTALKLAEDAEGYSRLDCLILRGRLNLRSNVDFRSEVRRLIQYHTGVHTEPWHINTVHWLKYEDSLIIRFNNKEIRNRIYQNRVPKDKNKRGMFIHECLTSSKAKLIGRVAKMRKNNLVHSYWTQNGQVFVKGGKDLPPILLLPEWSDEDIQQKLASQPNSYKDALKGATVMAPEVNHDQNNESTPSTCDINHATTDASTESSRMVAVKAPEGSTHQQTSDNPCSHVVGEQTKSSAPEETQMCTGSKTPALVHASRQSQTTDAPGETTQARTQGKMGDRDMPDGLVTGEVHSGDKGGKTSHESGHTSTSSAGDAESVKENLSDEEPTLIQQSKQTPSPQSVKKQRRNQRRKAKF